MSTPFCYNSSPFFDLTFFHHWKVYGVQCCSSCYDIYIIQSTVFVASSIIICISLWYEFTVKMSWTDFRLAWCKVLVCHQPLILAWRLIDLAFLWYTPLGDMNSRKSQFYVSLNALRIGSDANCREVKSVHTNTDLLSRNECWHFNFNSRNWAATLNTHKLWPTQLAPWLPHNLDNPHRQVAAHSLTYGGTSLDP